LFSEIDGLGVVLEPEVDDSGNEVELSVTLVLREVAEVSDGTELKGRLFDGKVTVVVTERDAIDETGTEPVAAALLLSSVSITRPVAVEGSTCSWGTAAAGRTTARRLRDANANFIVTTRSERGYAETA